MYIHIVDITEDGWYIIKAKDKADLKIFFGVWEPP